MQLSFLSIQGRNAIEVKHKPNLEDLGGTLILETRDKNKERKTFYCIVFNRFKCRLMLEHGPGIEEWKGILRACERTPRNGDKSLVVSISSK